MDWKVFLSRWSRDLMKSELGPTVKPPPESLDWLGFEPATTAEIDKLERRLGVTLPPSYKAFLKVTNGWRRANVFIDRVRPAAEVNWFRFENESWAEMYGEDGSALEDEEYYDYPDGSAMEHRAQHMSSLIQISDVEDGVYLLNPEAVTPDGEWEAWFFANWIPGAERYPSFAHMMLSQYRNFANIEGIDVSDAHLPELPIPDPSIPRIHAERTAKKTAKAPSLESLIAELRSATGKPLSKAIRIFHGKLKLRSHTTLRPDLVQSLVDLFYSSTIADVRATCVAGLTAFAPDGATPKPLKDALEDVNPGVVLAGMFSLHYFPNPNAVGPLCHFVESRVNLLFNETAMSALGEIGDPEAVPILLNVLLDTANKFDQSFGTAALALSRCGDAGFRALASAVDHSDVRVRRAVVAGLDTSEDPRAAELLDRMESDADETVRNRAKIRMGSPWGSV